MAPGLVAAEPGLGALTAAQILLSWSHAGRIRSEAAFAMLSGTAPVPVSSGRTDRHRLNRLGDRQLNRALHVIAVTRMRCHPPTLAYVQRRRAEGKTDREIRRCIKRYLARHLYRALSQRLTNIGASLALACGLDLTVQRSGDCPVRSRRGVLVDHRGAGAVMAHPRLEVTQARTRCGQHVAGVPQVMEMQARDAELADRCCPARGPAEVAPAQNTARGYAR